MNKTNNHYETLNITENATQEEIKKAYRKLSLKWHPDKNGGSAESIDMFQQISSAFEILSDINKKKEYDFLKNNPFMKMNNNPDLGPGLFNNTNIDEFFENIFFGNLNGNQRNTGVPFGFHVFNNGIPVNFVNNLQKPPPIIHNLKINIENIFTDKSLPVEIERWIIENNNKVFEKQTLYVNILKGIDDNEIIILKGDGNVVNEQLKGDVKIIINIENNTEFKRNGLDLIYEKNITLKESLCGFSFELKYINNKIYTINNNIGNIIKHNYNKIIPNMGIPRDNLIGNLIIHFKVNTPETLTMEQIEKIKEIL
jgi:DnaJ-class molecular chaperone